MADNNGYYGVGVLNLWVDSNHTQVAQNQLMLVPDGGSTAMMLGLGFLGLFVGTWKLNRRSHAA
jgi:IS4 transposase